MFSLKSCDYKAEPNKRANIHQAIENTIYNVLWNRVALDKLDEANIEGYLTESLEQEVKDNYEFLFMLLSLAYDAQSIKYVEENIESGTSEGIGYAIELLDIFIAEELKPKLFPILEDNTLNDKVRQLEPYYPIANFPVEDLIRQIINRNYNFTSRWTKACAMMTTLQFEKPEVTDDLIANLFNQDKLLRQCAGWVIFNIDEEKYHECSNRISEKQKRDLDEAIAMKAQYGYPMLYDLTIALSKSKGFERTNKFVLCNLSDHFNLAKSLENEIVVSSKADEHFNLFYLWEGTVSSIKNSKVDYYVEKGQLFGKILWDIDELNNAEFKAEKHCIYYVLTEEHLFDLMNQYSSLAHAIYTLAKEGHALQLT